MLKKPKEKTKKLNKDKHKQAKQQVGTELQNTTLFSLIFTNFRVFKNLIHVKK